MPGILQIRHRKSGQARLGFGADAGRALVANFAARAGRRAGKGRNGGRMIVRLHLHQDVDRLGDARVALRRRIRKEARRVRSLDHRRIVAIGGQHARGIAPRRWRESCRTATAGIGSPSTMNSRVEYLVAAMLGIRLREHHQFDIGRIAPERAERRAPDNRSPRPTARGPSRALARARAACAVSRRAHAAQRTRRGRVEQTGRIDAHRSSSDSVMRSCSSAPRSRSSARAERAPRRR